MNELYISEALLNGAITTFQKTDEGYEINDPEGKIEEKDGIKIIVYFDKDDYEII